MISLYSFYSAIFIYIIYSIRLFYDTQYLKELSTYFYGIAWGVVICGILIDTFYIDQIKLKYDLTSIDVILGDFLFSLLPLIIVQMYSPKKRKSPLWVLFMFPILMGFVYSTIFNLKEVYPGVPQWIFYILYPIISTLSVIGRFT